MRANLRTRVDALEQRLTPTITVHLPVTYRDGTPAAEVARLEAEALARFTARHGAEPGGAVAFIHRILLRPSRALEAAHGRA